MPKHLVVLECKKVSKMRLEAIQTLPRIFLIFLEFILIFLELFLFIRSLSILFMSSKCFIWIVHVIIHL
jgi:hypothetical protein